MGPPKVAPNWLRCKGALGAGTKLPVGESTGWTPQSLALKTVFLRNSNAEPWNSFVPDLVSTFTTPLANRPYSAL